MGLKMILSIGSQATAESLVEIGEKLTEDCTKLSDWMGSNSFKLNAGKTNFLTMGTSQRLQNIDEQLEETEDRCVVLLGVTIQCDLKWGEQIKVLAAKLKMRLAGLNRLRFIMNFFNRKQIVQGIFNSVLCYCLPVFGGCSNGEIMSLQVQQYQAARIVLKLPPRSNRDSMFNEL